MKNEKSKVDLKKSSGKEFSTQPTFTDKKSNISAKKSFKSQAQSPPNIKLNNSGIEQEKKMTETKAQRILKKNGMIEGYKCICIL